MFDVASIRAAHDKVIADTERLVHRTLDRAAPEAQKHVRDKPGFTHRSGATLGATKGRVYRTRGGGRLVVLNKDRKAHWLERGTRPHVIVPKRKKALRFFWRKIDQVVFFKRVNHPGTRPYWFLKRAFHHAADRVRLGVSRGMQRIARRF